MSKPEGLEPQVSIVMPVRNGEPWLRAALDAIVSQDLDDDFEVVVVDNGSTDASVAIAEDFASRIPFLEVRDASSCSGQAEALNAGVAASRGAYLLFLDADDVIQPGYVRAMVRALETQPFVAARLDCEALNPGWLRHSRPPAQEDRIGDAFGFLPAAAGCSIGIRRSTFEELGGFDSHIAAGNDIDLSWRAHLSSVPVAFVSQAVVQYRYRDTIGQIFTQGRSYGRAGPTLYRRYRQHGMVRRSWAAALRFNAGAFAHLLRARSKGEVALCAFLFGFRLGIIEGCWSQRVVYL